MGQVNLISQADYAKHRGVSEAAVSKAIKDKRITLTEGKIDPVAADAQWARNSRVRAGSGRPGHSGQGARGQGAGGQGARTSGASGQDPGVSGQSIGGGALGVGGVLADGDGSAAPGSDNYWNSRSRREAAEAELAEIALAEKNGQVIQVKAVQTVWSQALGSAREHLLQVRARLAPLLANESDPFKIEQMLDLEHSQALQHLARAQLQPGATA